RTNFTSCSLFWGMTSWRISRRDFPAPAAAVVVAFRLCPTERAIELEMCLPRLNIVGGVFEIEDGRRNALAVMKVKAQEPVKNLLVRHPISSSVASRTHSIG